MKDAVNTYEYRPCTVDLGITTKKGMFHFWTIDGHAIVEDETGQCGKYEAKNIMFEKPKLSDLTRREDPYLCAHHKSDVIMPECAKDIDFPKLFDLTDKEIESILSVMERLKNGFY